MKKCSIAIFAIIFLVGCGSSSSDSTDTSYIGKWKHQIYGESSVLEFTATTYTGYFLGNVVGVCDYTITGNNPWVVVPITTLECPREESIEMSVASDVLTVVDGDEKSLWDRM